MNAARRRAFLRSFYRAVQRSRPGAGAPPTPAELAALARAAADLTGPRH